MTKALYNQKKNQLYKKFGAVPTNKSHEVEIKTKFGIMFVSSEWSPSIKIANIHSRLDGNLQGFKEATNYPINTHNGKCNFYYSNSLEALDELDEYLENLKYLN